MTRRTLAVLMPLCVLGAFGFQPPPPAVPQGDQWLSRPVDDRTFKTYLDFFTYDRQVSFDARTVKVDEADGIRRERLSFLSTPGVRVSATLYHAAGAPGAKPPAVIFLHGGGGPGKDAPGVVRGSEFLSRAGWNVLAIDLLYFGERSTDLLTAFAEQEKHDKLYNQPSVYLAWITQTVKDVKRAYDFLVEQRNTDPRRIALMGQSRGAIAATVVAGAEPRLSPIVLLFAGHFDALETNHLPAACPANYIGRIGPRPLLMINGTEDSDMIKERAVDPLYKLVKPPKHILWTEGGHGFMTEEHRAAMIQWIRANQR